MATKKKAAKKPQEKKGHHDGDFEKLMKSRMAGKKEKCGAKAAVGPSLPVIGCCMPSSGCDESKPAELPAPLPKPVETVESLRLEIQRMRDMMHQLQAEAEIRFGKEKVEHEKLKAERDTLEAELGRLKIAAYALLNLPEPKKDNMPLYLALGGVAVGALGSALIMNKKHEDETKGSKGGKKGKKSDYKKIMNEIKKVLQQIALTVGNSNLDINKLVEDLPKMFTGPKTP
jgi:hypothetical protein